MEQQLLFTKPNVTRGKMLNKILIIALFLWCDLLYSHGFIDGCKLIFCGIIIAAIIVRDR